MYQQNNHHHHQHHHQQQQQQQQPYYQQYSNQQGMAQAGHQGRANPAAVRQSYRAELNTLTFNSKPIINSLTIAAGDNISNAQVIVQTIEERLRTAPPNQKLPTLYLIDSIIKNVGNPYVDLFGQNIVGLFLDAYTVVDQNAKTSFAKVLGTWPNWATPLFPRATINRIERALQATRQPQPPTAPMHNYNQPPPPTSAPMYGSSGSMYGVPPPPGPDAGLLADIQNLLAQKQHAVFMNPNDHASAKQVAILQQLESIVKTTQLTPESASMIRQQLSQLWMPAAGAAPGGSSGPGPVPPIPPVPPMGGSPAMSVSMAGSSMYSQPPQPSIPGSMMTPAPAAMSMPPTSGFLGSAAPPPPPPAPPAPPSIPGIPPMGSLGPIAAPSSMPLVGGSLPLMPVPIPITTPAATAPLAPPPAAPVAQAGPTSAASNLYASLLQSGLLGPNGTLALGNLTRGSSPASSVNSSAGHTPSTPSSLSTMPSAPTLSQPPAEEQAMSVMDLGPIELTSQGVQKRRPGFLNVLYGEQPLQCNQCGYRIPKSEDAQKKMDAHLDWHFRQNRRMKDKAKKSYSRSWLVGEEDWIHSREGDLNDPNLQHTFFEGGGAGGVVGGSGGGDESGIGGDGAHHRVTKDELAEQEEMAALRERASSEASLLLGLCGVDGAESLTLEEAHQKLGGLSSTDTNAANHMIAKGCSICKEKFIKVWHDAEEEWFYKNTIVVNKTIYHATCHAELVKANQRLQAREAALAAEALAQGAATADKTSSDSSMTPTENSQDKKDISQDEPNDTKDHIMKEESHDAALTASLKRKIDEDAEAEGEMAIKKLILEPSS
ncbi:hypothetical protein BGW41_002595 [Actinomortierella wolfii]|nr:hypothetical protein BGW41_002595 [Actinomortierella wolfii]